MKYFFILTLFFLLGGCGTSEKPKELFSTLYQKSFVEESSINTSNPDRGFYKSTYTLNKERDWNAFLDAKEDGFQLVYAPIILEEYVDTPTLPDSLLDIIEKNLQQAKDAQIKLIFRFSYRDSIDGDDPRRSIIEGHFSQLKALLQKYKDTISMVQAGTIGAWGEWHDFTGEYAESDPNYKANRKAIITKLSEIFPNKYIQMRTPELKEEIFGTDEGNDTSAEITQALVNQNSIISKIGFHDDCFVNNATDRGTYPRNNIEFWKSYVANDSQFVPSGGETCGVGGEDGDEVFSSCLNVIHELKRLHYAFLNRHHYSDIIQKWKDEGCYTEIQEKLGYSFVAKNLEIEKSDKNIKILLKLANDGYSRAYVDSNISFSLVSETKTYTYASSYNIRSLLPDTTHTIEQLVPLSDIESGSYCLYIKIGDDPSSIKLANVDLWDENSSSNKLMCGISLVQP